MKRHSWSRFSSAILPLHDCKTLPDLSGAFLLSMQALLEADVHAVNWFGSVKIRDISNHTGELIPDALEILNAHFHEHPLFPNVEATRRDGIARAARWTDFISLRRFQNTGLYHDFYRPLRSNRQVGLTLRINHKLALGLSFNRQGRDYRTEDSRALEALAPHIVHCARDVLGKAEIERTLLLREMAVGQEAVVIANGRGTVLFATDQARRLFQDYFSWPLDRGLPAPLLAGISSVEPMVHQVIAQSGRGTLLCSASAEVNWPAHLEARWAGSDYDARGVRCLRFTEELHVPDLTTWQKMGLTLRESEILHWIVQGKRDAEIAEILGASVRTVQKHVQNILWKFHVETRTAAAAEALRRSTAPPS